MIGKTLSTSALLALTLLPACGHGKFTSAAKVDAEKRAGQLKAATQFDMAMQQFQSGDLDRALRTTDASIAIAPDVSVSYLLRGRILLEMGRAEEALASLERGAEIDAKNAEFPYYGGIVLESVGRNAAALEAYQKASEINPAELKYRLAAAETMAELGWLDQAEAFLVESQDTFRYSPGLRQMMGHLAMMRGDSTGAIDHFQEAALLGADDPAILEDLARAQIAAGRFTDAEQSLKRLCDNPRVSERRDLRHLRARCLIETGRPVEARQVLSKLVEEKAGQNDVEAWVRMAEVAVMTNDHRQLRTISSKLITMAPDRHEGYLAQAMSQRREGDLPGALRSVDKSISLSRGNPAPAQLKSLILKQMGRVAVHTPG